MVRVANSTNRLDLNISIALLLSKRGLTMKKVSLLVVLLLFLGIYLGASRAASAQDDPPTRVARLNFIQGSVSYQPGGDEEQEWVAADPNRPLTTGDNLWSEENSRGELHIGSTAIRLGGQTGISILNLDDHTIQLQLTQGIIEVHVRRYDPNDAYEIDTPNLAFTIYAPGKYRIQTDPEGYSTMILVRDGEGQVTGGGQSYDVNPNQMYNFSGTDQLGYDVQPAGGPDPFESWSASRDLREDASASSRYVSRDMDGYYDLDDNGDWQNDPEYGPVWIPRNVVVGWAPYHDGHWVWVAPWGWTWVDSQPWGFAPFHYGRWTQVRGGYWGWVPGPPAVRPVYAPALVGFVGGGPGSAGVSIGFGGGFAGVAWFPLGPRDVYLPSYHTSPAYVQNINVTNSRVVNVTQVTNVYNTYHTTTVVNNVTVNRVNYTYANNAAAVTAVSRETFVGARPVQASAVRVTPEQLQTVRVVQTAQPLAPTRASYVSATARVTPPASRPPVAFAQTRVVARIAPPPPVARPGVAPRVAPPIISAGVAPKGGQPAARTNNAGAAVIKTAPPARPNANTNNRPPANNQPVNNRPVAPAPPSTPAPAPVDRSPDRSNVQPRPAPANTPPPARPQPAPAPQPAERPNNQPRPAPAPAPEPKPVTPERPAVNEKPAERPVPPPPAKTPPPSPRPEERNAPPPAKPAPPLPPPHQPTPAEVKEQQKQQKEQQKEADKKKNEKPPKSEPQQR
jgi:hypothetical protein